MNAPDFPTSRVDWRARRTQVWDDLMNGDRHLLVGTGTADPLARAGLDRDAQLIVHPIAGVRCADGVATRGDVRRIEREARTPQCSR